ncbi:MAG: SURF1 family protein [Pseudomonadota bacterium]
MKLPGRIVAWLPVVAGIAVFLLALALAQWQLDRAEQKRALQARWEEGGRLPAEPLARLPAVSDAWLYRRVRLAGSFAEGYQIYLDNRLHQGRAGYHVVVPLRLAGSAESVLVNRGWLRAEADRRHAPFLSVPPGEVTLEGILVRAQTRYLELGPDTVQGRVWQNLDLQRYRDFYGRALPDWLLLQTSELDDGLVRAWPRLDAGVDKHISYAGQWFALAATSLALTLVYLWRWRRGGNQSRAD